jgi:hypothetical protein
MRIHDFRFYLFISGDGAKSNSISIEKKIEFLESFTGKVCVCIPFTIILITYAYLVIQKLSL